MRRPLLAALASSTLWGAVAQIISAPTPSLSFKVTSGDNDNYFFRDNLTSAQLLLTSPSSTTSARRLVVALPAGNSGALAYFLPSNQAANSTLSVDLVEGSLKSTTTDYFNVGVQADLTFDGNATLGVTILGAVRAMRDYVEGGGTMNEIFNWTLAQYNETSLRLHRQWINTTSATSSEFKGADLYLTVPSGSAAHLSVTPSNNQMTPPKIDIVAPPGAANGLLRLAVVTNETSFPGLDAQELFLSADTNGTQGLQKALQGLADGSNMAAQQMSFLTYKSKFAAGGWRFLTYFGRDSLIALRLTMPVLTSEAIETVLGSVIERTNFTGALCHEETIGDYASFINIQNGQPELGNQPFYDYKMIDTDLLLLPALSHYLLELPQGSGRASEFFSRNATLQNGTYAQIMNRTIHYNIARATPFAHSPTVSNLIGLRPGQSVGNWRDSQQGLGYGFYPFDVNSALVPASLRAIQSLAEAGVLDFAEVEAREVGDIASVWEAHAAGLFEVTIERERAEARLRNFVKAANLSEALLERRAPAEGKSISFYGLSLKQDGTPVEVMNSDIGFNLMYGSNIPRAFLERVVDALQPYPRGLLTNVGMVVANPAYDSNATTIDVLDRTAYHGTVVWSFQQGLMAGGLARQLGFCGLDISTAVDTNPPPSLPPSWCTDAGFVQGLRDAQARLWTSIRGAKDRIYSEVWSYAFDNVTNTFSVSDLANISQGVESDAIQLWSYGFLGLGYTVCG